MPIINATQAFAYSTGTVSTVVLAASGVGTGITAANLQDAQRMRVTCNTNSVNYTYDGTAPTTSAGHNIPTSGNIEIIGQRNIANFKIIRSGGSDASVSITLEK